MSDGKGSVPGGATLDRALPAADAAHAPPPDPCVVVIFGASGDLTKRKLMPALYALAHEGLLPEQFAVVGVARREKTHESFREEMRGRVEEFGRFRPLDQDAWDRLARCLYYVPLAFEDAAGYARLREMLSEADRTHGTRGNRVYYLVSVAKPTNSCIIHELACQGARRNRRGCVFWA